MGGSQEGAGVLHGHCNPQEYPGLRYQCRDAHYMPCQLLVPLHILFPAWNVLPSLRHIVFSVTLFPPFPRQNWTCSSVFPEAPVLRLLPAHCSVSLNAENVECGDEWGRGDQEVLLVYL